MTQCNGPDAMKGLYKGLHLNDRRSEGLGYPHLVIWCLELIRTVSATAMASTCATKRIALMIAAPLLPVGLW